MRRPASLGVVAVLVAAAALLLFRAGSVALLDPDEARFARTSQEMLAAGDPVVPQFEGEPRLVKPPLLHWIQSLLFAAAGAGELVARLPSILALLASMAIVARLARLRFGGDEPAIWAAAVLGTMPLAAGVGFVGTIDALLAVHVLAAIALDLHPAGEGLRGRAAATGALCGLAFLAKGPVGTALPLLAMLAGRLATGRSARPRARALLQGAAAWCAVVLPWGLAFLHRVGAGDVGAVLDAEVTERLLGGAAHARPFWFYGPALLVATLPWCGALLAGLVRGLRPVREPAGTTARYASAALVACVLLLSASRGKQATYLAPLLPLAALVVVAEIGAQLRAPGRRSAAAFATVATLGSFAAALGVAAGRVEAWVAPSAAIAAGAVGIAALAAAACWWRDAARGVHVAAGAAGAAVLAVGFVLVLPGLAERRSAGPLLAAVPELAEAETVVTVAMKVPSLTYYRGRPSEEVALADLAERIGRADAPLYVFDEDDWRRVPDALRERLVEIGRLGKYRVLREGMMRAWHRASPASTPAPATTGRPAWAAASACPRTPCASRPTAPSTS